MIDARSEALVSLAEATTILPSRRQGKRPNVATLYRWSTVGCRGIVLETLQVGATRCTSREALQRFFEALTAQAQGTRMVPHTPPVLTAARKRSIDRAKKRLEAAGV